MKVNTLISWIRYKIKKRLFVLRFGVKKFCAYIAMPFRALRFRNDEKCQSSLDNFVQDKGKLSELVGFKYQKPTLDLSIIVPIYNVEKYIVDCLNSILNQKTKYSYEVIIVNDGSTDGTVDLMQPYLSDERIVFFEQKNQGQSVARNLALYNSKGKYIMCVDADDLLVGGAIDCLMDAATSTLSDIAEGGVVRFYSGNEQSVPTHCKNSKVELRSFQKKDKKILQCYGYSVSKVYKRDLWKTLRYPEGYIFEDVINKFILRRKANQVAFVDCVCYGYRMNFESSTQKCSRTKALDSIIVYPRIKELCERENAPLDEIFYLLSLNHIGLLNYVTVRGQDDEIKKACFVEMKNQLMSISEYRPRRLPLMFKALEKAILKGTIRDWEYVAKTITDYKFLKKYREASL